MSATVAAAEARAEAAKARLHASANELKARLSPGVLAGNAADGVRDKTEELVADGMDFAVRRPGVVAAAIGTVGLLLFRKRLVRRWRRRREHKAATRQR